jgi:hypothetical protein
MRVFGAAAEIADRVGRGFDPVVFFVCALDSVDPEGKIAPLKARAAALHQALSNSFDKATTSESMFEDFVQRVFTQALLSKHLAVYPVDVLRACIDTAEPAIVAAFGNMDVRRSFHLDQLEDLIPAEVLRDHYVEPTLVESPEGMSELVFEVVVSGPDFSDRSNRYATLAQAQWAANSLAIRAFGSPMFPPPAPDAQPRTISVVIPRRLSEATRIEIREC